MDYYELAMNVNPEDSPSAKLRTPHTGLLIEVLKLLDKSGESTYEPCQKLLAHSYWHWLPDYFFSESASSTGKYHPAFANGPRGLMLHSLAVARIADMLLSFYPMHDPDLRNLTACAAWLHDMLKYGDPGRYAPGAYTSHEHPKLAADFIGSDGVREKCRAFGFADSQVDLIRDLIAAHMGPYTRSKYSDVILEAPSTDLQQLLYMADYLASRKENDIVKDVM